MKRLVFLVMAVSPLTFGLAHAVPDRWPRLPELPERPLALDLRGTSWQGSDHVEGYRVTIEPDGTVTYGYREKSTRGGSWVQEGNHVYWEVNKKFRETRATIVGDVLRGESWNKAGKRWTTNLQRVSAPK